MVIRPARADDRDRIRDVAATSLRASYALSPDDIEDIVAVVFSDDALAARIDDDAALLAVAETDAVEGFVDLDLDAGAVRWLHVHPDARGSGHGSRLFDHARTALAADGHPLTVHHLDAGREGRDFLEHAGLERTEEATLDFADESYPVAVYEPVSAPAGVPRTVTADGEDLVVAVDTPISGTDAPFYPVHRDGERYGYLCGHCESVDVAADTLDRLECTHCNNTHLADTWDAAYL